MSSPATPKLIDIATQLGELDQQRSKLEQERQQELAEIARQKDAERLARVMQVAKNEQRIAEQIQSDYAKIQADFRAAMDKALILGNHVQEAEQKASSITAQAKAKLLEAGATEQEANDIIGKFAPITRAVGFIEYTGNNTLDWGWLLKSVGEPEFFMRTGVNASEFNDVGKIVLVLRRG